jgi:hypothetical protein
MVVNLMGVVVLENAHVHECVTLLFSLNKKHNRMSPLKDPNSSTTISLPFLYTRCQSDSVEKQHSNFTHTNHLHIQRQSHLQAVSCPGPRDDGLKKEREIRTMMIEQHVL